MQVDPYSPDELLAMGVECGKNVRIDRSVVLINPQHIVLGHDVRIDCFCVLSASSHRIQIGSWVHIACGCYLFGGSGSINIGDFCNLSSRVCLYTANDDYTGGHLTNPLVPDEFRDVQEGSVTLQNHVIIGSGSVVLPDVSFGLGASVGALSLVKDDVREFDIVGGTPARIVGRRGRELLELEKKVRQRYAEES
ncbi:MAG: acyltransferase [Planctomycetaceae bacterium]